MSKLTLDALKNRAEAVASEDVLATISGGTENACHDTNVEVADEREEAKVEIDGTYVRKPRVYDEELSK